jgi:hypothetical protein
LRDEVGVSMSKKDASVVPPFSQTKQKLLSDLAHIVIFSDDDSEVQATLEKMAVLETATIPSGRAV